MSKKVFIAYDFEIKGDLTLNLEAIAADPGAGLEVHWPGAPDGRAQGAIWNDIVKPHIAWCDRVLAFADLPNANVGFEVGYALAHGKEVAIARVREKLPEWLDQPPLNGFLCQRAETIDAIADLLRTEGWVKPPPEPTRGDGVLVLCPPGVAPARMVDPAWGWRRPEERGWDMRDVTQLFDRIGRVIWIIIAHNEGAEARDGTANSALAILAGYALGRGLTLEVFHHTNARKVVDVAARNEPFTTLEQLRNLLDSSRKEHEAAVAAKRAPEPTPAQQQLLTAEAARPKDLRPLPQDDWAAVQLPRFIGRDRELTDAREAVKAVASGDPNAARVWWVHGFGGMGKSWFLRRLALEAVRVQPDLGVLLVEWDSPTWREPLTGEPATPADIYQAIGHRLAQVRGVAATDPFWLAQARVEAAAEIHRTLRRDFDSRLMLLKSGESIDSALLDELRSERLVDDEGRLRPQPFEKWRADRVRRERVFVAWATKAGSCPLGPDEDAAVVPQQLLRRGLTAALQAATTATPLLLVLDTCEVLSEELDHALRSLITPLATAPSRLMVLIGSRLAPDVAQPAGSREGWRAELHRLALREVPFGENVFFTVEEIEAALKHLKRPAPPVKHLAERLRAATQGVPLAVRSLFDIHEQDEQSTILTELAAADEHALQEAEAVRNVIGTVANRMLYHLANRPDREEDLADFVALALLPRANANVLAQLWPMGVRPRLRDLARRYSLLGGGDLHPTVRRYLRRHWRGEDRPAMFDRVLGHLRGIVESLPAPGETDGMAAAIELRLLQVTLASWRQGADCGDQLARGLTVALAWDEGTAPFLDLLRELAETLPHELAHRDALPRGDQWEGFGFEFWGRARLLDWLHGRFRESRTWTPEEAACARLIHGLHAREPDTIPAAREQITDLLEVISHYGAANVPQPRQVAEALWSAAVFLQDTRRLREEPDSIPLVERAYLAAIQLTPDQAALHNNIGNLYLSSLNRPEVAEQHYRQAIELDPKWAYPRNGLGGLYRDVRRQPFEAEREYLEAIKLDPTYHVSHRNLGLLYHHDLKRPEDAERAYRKAIEVNPGYVQPHIDLGNLYKDKLERFDEAEREYLKAIELDPMEATPHNNLGNLYMEKLDRPRDAEREYLAAIELDPRAAHTHTNLANLYRLKLNRPQDAEREYLKAIELAPTNADTHNNLGNLLQDLPDRATDAEHAYLKALELEPNFQLAQTNLGLLYQNKLNRPLDAERTYLKAIEIDPQYASAHNDLGTLYKNLLDRPLDAERAYLKAIELAPRNSDYHNNLGSLYHDKLSRPEDAEREYLKAIELNPASALPHSNLGLLYQHKLDRPLDAEREFLKAIELDPANAERHVSLGSLYQDRLNRLPDAEHEYLKAIELAPANAAHHKSLGLLYQNKLNRPLDAERAYLKAIELAPLVADHQNNLGSLYHDALGRLPEAERAYLKALELDPQFTLAHTNLGLLYQNQLNRPLDAEREFLKAIELDPRSTFVHHQLGRLYQDALDRPLDAEREFLKTIELDAGDASIQTQLGRLYHWSLGRPEAAERAYLAAIALKPDGLDPHQGLADLYQHHLARPADAEREYRRTLELDATNLPARQGLVFLYLTDRPNPALAQAEYTLCLEAGPDTFGTRLCGCALALWNAGWDEAKPLLAGTLGSPAGAEVESWHGEMRLIVRKVRALERFADLAALLREAATQQAAAGPWAEAVTALANGNPPPGGPDSGIAQLHAFLAAS